MNLKHILRTLILALVRIVGAPGVYWMHSKHKLLRQPRILLIRPDHLGDLVLTTPVLDALREYAPHAHITMMIGPWSSGPAPGGTGGGARIWTPVLVRDGGYQRVRRCLAGRRN